MNTTKALMNNLIELLDSLNIHNTNKDETKLIIKSIFDKKIKNKKYNKSQHTHYGSEGVWLEKQFKEDTNNSNFADFMGYEIKKHSSKITFGDWSANEYIFCAKDVLLVFNKNIQLTKLEFLKLFGRYNHEKKRYSWSGSVSPSKYDEWTSSGQILLFNSFGDLFILYSYARDTRRNIEMPNSIQEKNYILLAYWNRNTLQERVERKFNNHGTVIVKKNKNGIYQKLCFYKQITFEIFMKQFKNKIIIFDSGMYEGNSRNYSQFRTNVSFWDTILDEEYEGYDVQDDVQI
jgi:hypothetical protein